MGRRTATLLGLATARLIGRSLFWLAVFAGALALSAWLHFDTAITRRVVRDLLNEFVSSEIRGALSIGRIDTLSKERVVARHVALFDPWGTRIVVADEVVLAVDFDAIVEGRLRFSSAKLRRGTVRLVRMPSGLPSLIETFAPSKPSKPSRPGSAPLHAVVDGLRLNEVTVYGDIFELDSVRVEQVSALGRLEVQNEVEITIHQASGDFVKPFDFVGHVDRVSGSIHSNPYRGVRLKVEARRAAEPAGGEALATGEEPAADEEPALVQGPGKRDKSTAKARATGSQASAKGDRPASGQGPAEDHAAPPGQKPKRAEERASAVVTYALPQGAKPDDDQVLDVQIETSGISSDTVRGLGHDWMIPLRLPLKGKLRLHGRPAELKVDARVSSQAGNATVEGYISKKRGVSVAVQTDGLELARIMEGAPDLKAAGVSRIKVLPGRAEPRLRLHLEPLLYENVAIPAFEVEGVLSPEGIRVDKVWSQQGGSRVSGHGTVSLDGGMDLHLRASIPQMGRDRHIRRHVPGAEGRLDADVHVMTPSISRRAMRFQGRVLLRDLRYGPVSAKSLELKGSAGGDPDLPRLNVRVRGTQVTVADYPLGDTQFSLRGGPREYAAAGQVQAMGKQTFHLDARIKADRRRLTANVEQMELVMGDRSWRGTARNLELVKGKMVTLELLRLASRSQRLEAKGAYRFHGPDELTAQLQDFDLAVLRALLGEGFTVREGRADTHVELRGDVSSPELLVQGALRGGAVLGLEDIGGVYFLTYKDGNLQVDAEADLGQRGMISVTGSGALDASIRDPIQALRSVNYELAFTADNLDILLANQLSEGAVSWLEEGRVKGTLGVRGTLERPGFSGQLSFAPMRLQGWSALSVDTEFNYVEEQLTANLKLADDNGELGEVDAEMALSWDALINEPQLVQQQLRDGPWVLSGNTAPRRLDQMPAPLVAVVPWPVRLYTRFEALKEEGSTSGDLSFEVEWVEQLPGATCANQSRPRVRGEAILYAGLTHFVATGFLGSDRFAEFEGTAQTPVDDWVRDGAVSALGSVSTEGQVDIPSLSGFPWVCEHAEGKLEASVALEQLFTAETRGSVQLSSTMYPKTERRTQRPWQQQGDSQAGSCPRDPLVILVGMQAKPEWLQVSGNVSGCHGGPALLSAQLPMDWAAAAPAWTGDREMLAKVDFDGAQLRPLLDRIPGIERGRAVATGTLVAKGKPAKLRFQGRVALSDGELHVPATGQELTDLSGALVGRGNWLQVSGLSVRDGDGWLRTSGSVGMQGWVPNRARLALAVESFPVKREGMELAKLTGGAELETEIGERRSESTLSIRSLNVVLPEIRAGSLRSLEPHPDVEIAGSMEQEEYVPDPYEVQVTVDGANGFWVHRSDIDARVAALLDVLYADPELRVDGYIGFERGTFEVFGKSFRIVQGSLRFDGSAELNPKLNLTASHTPRAGGGSPVVVTATGTLLEPDLSFHSQDCEGEEGALTALLTGRCMASERAAASQDTRAQSEAFAAALGGGLLTLGARRELGDLIRTFSIESTDTGRGYRTRMRAGVNADAIIPEFMRGVVRGAYLQGAVTTTETEDTEGGGTAGTAQSTDMYDPSLVDLLLELYLPFSLVWSAKLSPGASDPSWGTDLTWEP